MSHSDSEIHYFCKCISDPGKCPAHDESAYSRDCETNSPIPATPPAVRAPVPTERTVLSVHHEIRLPCGHDFRHDRLQSENTFKIRLECHCGTWYILERQATGLELQRTIPPQEST